MDAILLSPLDNVAVVVRRLPAGSRVKLEEGEVMLDRDLGLGHKIARRAIASGEKIVKYGVAIGSATCAIAPSRLSTAYRSRSSEPGRLS